MRLTPAQATSLQTAIQSAISNISIAMEQWGDRTMLKTHEINDVNDFVYGYVMGLISNAFFYIIFISEGRSPSQEEIAESKKIISEWNPKIRRTISIERYRIRMNS
jgi:hypothetical protein